MLSTIFYNIWTEIRIIFTHAILPAILVIVLDFLGMKVNWMIVCIYMISFINMVALEDEELFGTEPVFLSVRLATNYLLFYGTLYIAQLLVSYFAIKEPFFDDKSTWCSWGIEVVLEYLELANAYSAGASRDLNVYLCRDFSEGEGVAPESWQPPVSLLGAGADASSSPAGVFKLVKREDDLKCSGQLLQKSISIENSTREVRTSHQKQLHFLSNGYLVRRSKGREEYIDETRFCILRLSTDEITFQYCEPNCFLSHKESCIPKCCRLNQLLSTGQGCVANTGTWNPVLYNDGYDDSSQIEWSQLNTHSSTSMISNTQHQSNSISYGDLLPTIFFNDWSPKRWEKECGTPGVKLQMKSNKISALQLNPVSLRNETFRIQTDGKLFVWDFGSRNWAKLEGPHCVDSISDKDHVLVFCGQKQASITSSFYYGIIEIFTSFFALITFLVHLILWEKQNIHSWNVMTFSISLFIFFLFSGLAHLLTTAGGSTLGTGYCITIATVTHVFNLATFSWLMIISLDLYLTFRAILVSKSKGRRRYFYYSLLGWGIPLSIVTVAWILQLIYGQQFFSSVKVPGYGERNCYIRPEVLTPYLYGPSFFMYIANVSFFILTLFKLWEYKKSTRFAREDSKQDRQSFVLFVKLFFVTGVLWIIEFCGWYFAKGEARWYWMLLDLCNCLQPVSLFIIFVMKVDVLNSIADKYPVSEPIISPVISHLKWLENKLRLGIKKTRSRGPGPTCGGGGGSNSSSSRRSDTLATRSTICDDEDTEV